MNNPEYVKVDGTLYKINTDFRVALECNKIANDISISDYERAIAIIYLLFGDEGLKCNDQNKLVELAIKYLTLSRDKKSLNSNSQNKHNLDFNKCERLISSSFKFDYNYNPYELEYLHWYDFYSDLENLSTSEFGTCCKLNQIASIINYDTKKIKDNKERHEMEKLKKELIEKYCIDEQEKAVEITKEQEESSLEFYKALGINL